MVTAPKVLVIDCGRVTNPDCEAGMEAVGAAMGVTAGAAEAGHKAAWAPARSDPAVTNYWARAFEAAGAEYTNERAAAAEAALAPALRTTFPATLRVVERAKKAGLTIGVISNHLVSPPLFEYCAEGAGLHELASDSSLVIVSQQVGLGKPDPAIYKLFYERLRGLDASLQPEDLVFVDDKKKNVDAAIALGWRGIVHDATVAGPTDLADALTAMGVQLAAEAPLDWSHNLIEKLTKRLKACEDISLNQILCEGPEELDKPRQEYVPSPPSSTAAPAAAAAPQQRQQVNPSPPPNQQQQQAQGGGNNSAVAAVIQQLQSNPQFVQALLSNQQMLNTLLQQVRQGGGNADAIVQALQMAATQMQGGGGGGAMAGGGMGGQGTMGGMGGAMGMGGPGMGGMQQGQRPMGMAGAMGGPGGAMGGGPGAMGMNAMGAGNMGGAAAMGMGGGGAQPLSRSVFIKKLPNNLSLEDLVNEVGIYGPIESYRVDNDRHEAFVNFVEGSSAAALIEEKTHGISFANQIALSEVQWGKKKALDPSIANAIQQGATRNLYIGNLPEGVNQQSLQGVFAPAGPIESVRIMNQSGNGYVNYASVESAIQAVGYMNGKRAGDVFAELQGTPSADVTLTISFTTANQLARGAAMRAGAGRGGAAAGRGVGVGGRGGGLPGMGGVNTMGHPAARGNNSAEFRNLQPSRSVYVGNLPQGTAMRDLTELSANFGLLEGIRFHHTYAFLNFIEEQEAITFWQQGQQTGPGTGVWLRGRSLAVNWAKLGQMDSTILSMVQQKGATRHLNVGPINHQTTEQQVADLMGGQTLKQMGFDPFGEIESVRLFPDKGIAVLTFQHIKEAIACQEALHGYKMGDSPPWSLDVQFGPNPFKGSPNAAQPKPAQPQPQMNQPPQQQPGMMMNQMNQPGGGAPGQMQGGGGGGGQMNQMPGSTAWFQQPQGNFQGMAVPPPPQGMNRMVPPPPPGQQQQQGYPGGMVPPPPPGGMRPQ